MVKARLLAASFDSAATPWMTMGGNELWEVSHDMKQHAGRVVGMR